MRCLSYVRLRAAHLSVETELLDFIDAVDHHVHEGEQRVHVFGRRVAHAGHYTQKPVAHLTPWGREVGFTERRWE